MRLRFLLVILAIPILLHAQECKYLHNKISGMDGSRLIITEPVVFSSQRKTGNMEIWSTIYGDTVVVLAFIIYPQHTIEVSKGDSLVITLDNNIVYLTIHQDAITMGKEEKKLTILSLLNKQNMEKLESFPSNTISISTSEGKISYLAKKKKQTKVISYLIDCVKDYLYEGHLQ